MRPATKNTQLSGTLTLSECHDGFWLYDETRGMNLSMRASTRDAAFIEALGYYQNRLASIETAHKTLKSKVDAFVSNFIDDTEED